MKATTTPISAGHHHPLESLDSIAVTRRYYRGQEICSQARPAEYWYRVTAGAARRCVILSGGRRQIVDLLLPGNFFAGSDHENHDFAIEAVMEGTVVIGYPRRRAEKLAEHNPQLTREIQEIALETISRLQEQLLILGRTTALEKVGCFLLLMAERLSAGGADRVHLPISRYDIADYLALSVETVSRSLTDLKHRGMISLAGTRQVRIVNRSALEDGDYNSTDGNAAQRHQRLAAPRHLPKSTPVTPYDEPSRTSAA
jgi:CRP-like cAMP-binding protein